MKNLLFLILISWGLSLSAQKLTKEERELVRENPTEMMRVFNRNNPSDSLILKSLSTPIKAKHKLTQLLADRMLLSVKHEGGVGIAAPQVGINRRMFWVQRFDKAQRPFELFINPEILWASDLMQKGSEGDLSFDERGFVMRNYAIQIQYEDLKGEIKTEILEGFTSVIFQHERDHLDGILLTDRIKEQENMIFEQASGKSDLYFLKN
ncbi:MAG: peptide deformylase [Flavobacteriaceae bacterium]|jgi:peptide deformylase|nr:peptide deformylase [Flavobacteriaceae bacterium]